ncbi:xin actin-binding repeat-containing protein 2 isoform X1 [Drosophila subpulchrella]|uniref:xin actin-binding repeat-containing protein 2 isoform X1 n=1 Tax=Drosophila subpulchrella TaxID=1486046 RepID=UPI0018A13C5A|nr:xin actin-binding repeat-containing protein 2 isoform X1 [Drosophila subpulchrella]
MSSSTPGSESALVKVATPSPSPLARMDVDYTGSKFEMHSSLSDEERRFYIKMYPNVDLVNQRKVHCTVCKQHLGTAPASENNIKMHPILRVTHCVKCHDFYNSGEFSKGEDGSELYCRWCGQGGEVYCCSTCPYVFCKSCIVKNLSKGVIVDIEQNEHWNCFSCTSKILWPLRAQHWALVNYLETQKRALQGLQLSDVEARRQMLKDNSNCCRLAKSKASSLSDSMESLESNVSKRSHNSSVSSNKRGSMPKAVPSAPPAKRPKSSNDEVVCTPDLLSMLEPDCQLSVTPKPAGRQSMPAASVTTTPRIVTVQQNYQPGPSSSNNSSNGSASGSSSMTMPRSNLPPPLVLSGSGIRYRQTTPGVSSNVVRRTVVPNAVKSAGPVFHTINGYRVDLNSAAQQDSYRLPNGRLIQVKRQMPQAVSQPSPPPPPPALSIPQVGPGVVIRPRPPNPPSRPSLHISTYGSNMGIYNPQSGPPQRPPQVRVANPIQGPPPLQGPPPNANGGQTLMITPAPPPPPKVPTLVRHNFPNTPMGQARAQLQEQIFSAMDICTHLTGKVVSLTHSNAYNQVRNYLELKELYIHMSYLMTYAIGRFKNLQEKCLVDMREKGFKNDANSLENGQLAAEKQASDDEDNEIEIVEPKTDTITIDSDNEDDTPSTSSQQQPQQNAIMKITSVTSAAPKSELKENQAEIDVAAFSSTILASLLEVEVNEVPNEPKSVSPGQKKQPRKKTTNKPNPALLQLERQRMEEMKKSDAKLKMKVVVRLKRAEDEFEVARKWVEDCRKREQKLGTGNDSSAAKEVSANDAAKEPAKAPSEKAADSIKKIMEKPVIQEKASSAKKESIKEQGEDKVTVVDKEKVKNKEKIGNILKAAIKAKIGEKEKKLAEENLAQDENTTESEKKLTYEKTGKEKLVSKEIEIKKVSALEKEKVSQKIEAKISEKELAKEKNLKEDSKKESSKQVSKEKKADGTEMEVDSEISSEKEQVDPKEVESQKVSKKEKSAIAEMEVESEIASEIRKVDQKEKKEEPKTAEKNSIPKAKPIVKKNVHKPLKEYISEAKTSVVEKGKQTEKPEQKPDEVSEKLKKNAVEKENDISMESEKDTIKDTEADTKEIQNSVAEVEPVDLLTSNIVESMDTCNENDQPSAAELLESMDVGELVETPKELLDCAIDEVIAMDGIELSEATEELMKVLNSPSALASDNANEDETDSDANDLIENIPLETTEPPEILLKEDEGEVSSKSGPLTETEQSRTPSASSGENGDTEMESTQDVSDSAQDEPATAQIVG